MGSSHRRNRFFGDQDLGMLARTLTIWGELTAGGREFYQKLLEEVREPKRMQEFMSHPASLIMGVVEYPGGASPLAVMSSPYGVPL